MKAGSDRIAKPAVYGSHRQRRQNIASKKSLPEQFFGRLFSLNK
jgi:hypothetical protein